MAESRQARAEFVEGLTRRTAHACFALLCAIRDLKMPPTVQEIMIFDEESYSSQQTAAGLRHAHKLGLCACQSGYWVAAASLHECERQLEERVLAEIDAALEAEGIS